MSNHWHIILSTVAKCQIQAVIRGCMFFLWNSCQNMLQCYTTEILTVIINKIHAHHLHTHTLVLSALTSLPLSPQIYRRVLHTHARTHACTHTRTRTHMHFLYHFFFSPPPLHCIYTKTKMSFHCCVNLLNSDWGVLLLQSFTFSRGIVATVLFEIIYFAKKARPNAGGCT